MSTTRARPWTGRLAIAAAVAGTSLITLGSPAPVEAVPPGFSEERVTGIDQGTDLEFLPTGEILVSEKNGRVVIVDDGVLLPTPALDLSASLCNDIERGVSGIAVHPDFETNRWIYVYYTYPKFGNCGQSELDGPVNRLSRFVLPPSNVIDPASEVVLLDTPPMFKSNHNSGYVEFGNDGFLYVSIGDSGIPFFYGWQRDLGYLNGKIVRITDDGDIPATNPYQGPGTARCNIDGVPPAGSDPGTACQEVFASGLRNPFRLAFDPNTTDTRFFINDVGHTTWESIDEGQVGADYGWPQYEGPCERSSVVDCTPQVDGVDPLYWYGHDGEDAAITAGAFVPNGLWPSEYDNTYIFADYAQNQLFHLVDGGADCRLCLPPTSALQQIPFASVSRPVAMRFGPHNGSQALYVIAGNFLRRITYTGSANRSPVAVASASPTWGALPLDVEFDATASTDPDDDTLSYLWDFGDGTTSTDPVSSHVYTTAGSYTATLTVDDGNGATDTASVRVDPGNSAPTVTIDSPTAAELFEVGEELTLHATATDPEDGPLPDSSITWEARQHHNEHYHPFLAPVQGNDITIVGPEPEDLLAATNSYIEILVTATDSTGLATTVSLDVQPNAVQLDIASEPPGLAVFLDGQEVITPESVTSWADNELTLDAPDQPNGVGGTWFFDEWSDGGAQNHSIIVDPAVTSYAATFVDTIPLPTMTPGEASVVEGNVGQSTVQIPVTLSEPFDAIVTAEWTTVDYEAGSPGDFIAVSGTVQFDPGETAAFVEVTVNGDEDVESDEYLTVAFGNPVNAEMGGYWGLGFGLIINDDLPTVIPGAGAVLEGDDETATLLVPVTLSSPVDDVVTVDWSTVDFSAVAGTDYEAASGTAQFDPGETETTVAVTVTGDHDVEPDEVFLVAFGNATNAKVGGFWGLGFATITNDDVPAVMSIADASIEEGDTGDTTVDIAVTLDDAVDSPVSAVWLIVDGTAVGGVDMNAGWGFVSFEPGETEQFASVTVLGDTDLETDETFEIRLSNFINAEVGDGTATVTILDDDDGGGDDGEVGNAAPTVSGAAGATALAVRLLTS